MLHRKDAKMRIWLKNRWLRAVVLALAVVALPYAISRFASRGRAVAVYSSQDLTPTELQTSELRIACYNIAHGRGLAESNWDGGSRAERTARLDDISDLLRSIDADIVVLNEVDFDSSWSHSVNQARYLAEKSGYAHWVEQRNVDFRVHGWTWRFGNAVLSKYPIASATLIDLPGYSMWETVLAGKKRGVVCEVDVGDHDVRIFGVHLSHRREAVRVRSANCLADLAAATGVPTIVAGDLNSTPIGLPISKRDANGNNAINTLDSAGIFRRSPISVPVADRSLTFHSAEPKCAIDWILIPRGWRFIDYTVVSSQLSDHRPVYTDVSTGPVEH